MYYFVAHYDVTGDIYYLRKSHFEEMMDSYFRIEC